MSHKQARRNALRLAGAGMPFRGGGIVASEQIYTSLTAFWQLGEESGNRADSIGASTLTDTNTVTAEAGLVYANAAYFNSANSEYLTVNDNAALSTGNITFWCAVWLRLATGAIGSTRCVLAKNATSANREYRLTVGTDGVPVWFALNNNTSSGQVSGGSALAEATWYLLTCWHDADADQVGIAINNGTPATANYTGGAANSTAAFRLGMLQETNSQYYLGRIGPVMFGKSYVPTANDRAWLYNGGSGRTLAAMAAL